MKSLKEHFESILEACRSCAEVGDEEEIPDVELRELSDYIEKELPQLLED